MGTTATARNKQVERLGNISAPYTVRYPEVRGGVCEHCGVIDGNFPSERQYQLCKHFQGMQLRCSYCPAEKDPEQIIAHSVIQVADHPTNPGQLVVWCNSYDCSNKHIARFKVSS